MAHNYLSYAVKNLHRSVTWKQFCPNFLPLFLLSKESAGTTWRMIFDVKTCESGEILCHHPPSHTISKYISSGRLSQEKCNIYMMCPLAGHWIRAIYEIKVYISRWDNG
jgi:hypothetical protein